eukprot:6163733-Prymnesium_polylepis.1
MLVLPLLGVAITALLSLAWPLLSPVLRGAATALFACRSILRSAAYAVAALAAAAAAKQVVSDWRDASLAATVPLSPLATLSWLAPAVPATVVGLHLARAALGWKLVSPTWLLLAQQQGLLVSIGASLCFATAVTSACTAVPALSAPEPRRLWPLAVHEPSAAPQADVLSITDFGIGCQRGCAGTMAAVSALCAWAAIGLLASITRSAAVATLAAAPACLVLWVWRRRLLLAGFGTVGAAALLCARVDDPRSTGGASLCAGALLLLLGGIEVIARDLELPIGQRALSAPLRHVAATLAA